MYLKKTAGTKISRAVYVKPVRTSVFIVKVGAGNSQTVYYAPTGVQFPHVFPCSLILGIFNVLPT